MGEPESFYPTVGPSLPISTAFILCSDGSLSQSHPGREISKRYLNWGKGS